MFKLFNFHKKVFTVMLLLFTAACSQPSSNNEEVPSENGEDPLENKIVISRPYGEDIVLEKEEFLEEESPKEEFLEEESLEDEFLEEESPEETQESLQETLRSVDLPTPEEDSLRAEKIIPKPFQFPAGCEIPESARIVHIPQIIPFVTDGFNKNYIRFLDENIARNQFLIARILLNHRNNLYLEERLTFILDFEQKGFIKGKDGYIARSIIFNPRTNYNDLSQTTKDFLSKWGGSFLLFYSGYINTLYPVTSLGDNKRIRQKASSLREELKNIRKDKKDHQGREDSSEYLSELEIKEKNILQELNYYVKDAKELLLKNEVIQLMRNSNKKIFFTYSHDYDFSDEFAGENFHKIPDACIIPEGFLMIERYRNLNNNFYKIEVRWVKEEAISSEEWEDFFNKSKEDIAILERYVKGKNKIGVFYINKNNSYTAKEIEKSLEKLNEKLETFASSYGY